MTLEQFFEITSRFYRAILFKYNITIETPKQFIFSNEMTVIIIAVQSWRIVDDEMSIVFGSWYQWKLFNRIDIR